MIQSCPPALARANEIFHFHLANQRSSPTPPQTPEEDYSSINENDEESMTESYEQNRSNSIEAVEERPLNLSCKKRNVDEEGLSMCQSGVEKPLNLLKSHAKIPSTPSQSIPSPAIEQALLQYHAQVLASNDYLRALAHQRLQESFLGRTFYSAPPIPPTLNPWLPNSRFQSIQRSIYSIVPDYRYGNAMDNVKSETSKSNLGESDVTTSALSFIVPPSKLPPTTITSKLRQIEVPKAASDVVKNPSSFPQHSKPQLPAFEGPEILNEIPNKKLRETNPNSLSLFTQKPSSSSSFDTNDSNRKRKRPKRSDEKPTSSDKDSFSCTICGASYPHKFELNRHVKVSHVRPHRCGECGKGFGHRNYLKVHIETVHLGQKSHQCRLCGKFLSTGGNLNVHVRTIHFGEKKYNCPVCNRSFGQQCNMKTHMKRHYAKSEEA